MAALSYAAYIFALFVVGASVGNYATSLVYRLPRGLKIANDPPYCDHCRHYLAERDKLPIFSWLLSRGKCRFCGVAVPSLYTWVEVASAALFIAAWLRFGMGEAMLLTTALGMCWIVLGAIAWSGAALPSVMLIVTAATGALWRTYTDQTIYPWLGGAFFVGIGAYLAWRLARRPGAFAGTVMPPVLAALALGKTQPLADIALVGAVLLLPLLPARWRGIAICTFSAAVTAWGTFLPPSS